MPPLYGILSLVLTPASLSAFGGTFYARVTVASVLMPITVTRMPYNAFNIFAVGGTTSLRFLLLMFKIDVNVGLRT